MMKHTLTLMALASIGTQLSAITITTFGDLNAPTLTVDYSDYTVVQSSGSLQISGIEGDAFGGSLSASQDYSAVFGIQNVVLTGSTIDTGSLNSAGTPNSTFTIRFYNTGFNLGTYADYVSGSWISLRDDGSSVLTYASSVGGFDPSDVVGFDLLSNGIGGAGINATLTKLDFSPVPEPSTYAALAGVVALGAVMLRRRRS